MQREAHRRLYSSSAAGHLPLAGPRGRHRRGPEHEHRLCGEGDPGPETGPGRTRGDRRRDLQRHRSTSCTKTALVPLGAATTAAARSRSTRPPTRCTSGGSRHRGGRRSPLQRRGHERMRDTDASHDPRRCQPNALGAAPDTLYDAEYGDPPAPRRGGRDRHAPLPGGRHLPMRQPAGIPSASRRRLPADTTVDSPSTRSTCPTTATARSPAFCR